MGVERKNSKLAQNQCRFPLWLYHLRRKHWYKTKKEPFPSNALGKKKFVSHILEHFCWFGSFVCFSEFFFLSFSVQYIVPVPNQFAKASEFAILETFAVTMKIFISGTICVVRGLTSSELAGGALYIYVRQEIKYTRRQEMKSPNLTDNS